MLAAANVRDRWSSFLGAFSAIALGIALITTTLLVFISSSPKVPPRVGGTPVLAVASASVNLSGSTSDRMPWSDEAAAELAGRLGSLDGVSAAVEDRGFYLQAVRDGHPVADPNAEGAGHGWSSASLAPYGLASGRAPTAVGEVVVDDAFGARVGSTLPVLTATGQRDLRVVGTVNGPGFYLSDAEARSISPGVRAIGLLLRPGASASDVRDAAEGVVGSSGEVVTGAGRSVLEPEYISHTRWLGTQLISAMAILGGFVTVFVVAATFALGAAQRRREIGLLRTIGAAPRQIRRMILGEAVFVGAAGAVAGAVLGVVLAPLMGELLLAIGVSTPDFVVEVAFWPLAVSVLIGLAVAVLGAWAASHRAAKVVPMEALRDSQVEKRPMTRGRWLFGGGALGVGVLLSVLTAGASADDRVNMALATAMVLTVAAAMLAPVVIGPLVRLVTWPARRAKGAGPVVVRAELITAARRTASTAAPIIATVGFAVLLSGMVTTMQSAYPAGETAKLRGLSVVVPDGAPGLTDTAVGQVGVGRSSLPTRIFLDRPGYGRTVVDGVGNADPKYADRGGAVVSTSLAAKFDWKAGQRVDVRFVDGRDESLTIASVQPDDPARGDFVMARALVRAHDGSAMTDSIFIQQAQAPASVGPGARIHDAETYALAKYEKENRLLLQFAIVLIVVAVGYTGIAVANTTAMSAQARRPDFRVLKSAGATVRQVLRLVTWETTVVVGIGTLLGLLVTIPPLAAMASGLAEATATPVSLQMDWATVVFVVVACLALAVAASVLMTWRSIRTRRA
ncbi:putative ABC transport system permease protein [Actinokineospora baliensis]|uniref:ABC transporter permease n=1 Tax=Actinokineospora baliensis TaxID=547056 RepID=UPI00195A5C21|nr:ABC transporter permease [Actinokineospora baliensis]MBM7776033.1 putative ABC transport system permease protein [Actinokineospora baliensis]